MNKGKKEVDSILVTFARLPIFDNKKKLWGYELVYLPTDNKNASNSGQDKILTPDLMSDTAVMLDRVMDKSMKVMVNFSITSINDGLPYALPPGRTIIKIEDPLNILGSQIDTFKKLREDGYQIAIPLINDYTSYSKILEITDMICLDISKSSLPDLTGVINNYPNSRFLVNSVDNQMKFDIGYEAGFSFFKGFFFKQPENLSVKKVLPGTISRFQLLEAIEQSDPNFEKLATAIQADVAISFRLFSYLNSASFGFRRKIDSIKDAITLLGWQNLKNWLRVVLFAEISENQNSSELIFLSAQRGKFLEQIGRDHDFWGFEPDSLFLLGMFSLLDALLNQPMSKILKYLPLTDKLKGALCMEDNNEYVPLLKLARYFEEARFDQSDAKINQLGLDTAKVKQAYSKSIEWANKLTEMKS